MTIRVKFHSKFGIIIKGYILSLLKRNYDVVECDNYDFYFAQETIYLTKKDMYELLDCKKDAIRIFFCGEAVYPDMNLFDYAIVIQNNHMSVEDRVLYLPYIELNNALFFETYRYLDRIRTDEECETIIRNKSKFCNFIYSNGKANKNRDLIFYKLSEYKRVDSLGSHLKNIEIEDTRHDINWDTGSILLKEPYKFSIAAENARFYGYTSEKIITSFLANTIPIYWGNSNVCEEYNTKAFVNVMETHNFEKVIDRVREIDKNDDVLISMLKQPARTENQVNRCNQQVTDFYNRFTNIFVDNCIRRPIGSFEEFTYTKVFKKNVFSIL